VAEPQGPEPHGAATPSPELDGDIVEVTRLLDAIDRGEGGAAEELLPVVYEELRRLARSHLSREGAGQTLQATELVHEAYLRLVGAAPGAGGAQWHGRDHFFAVAARAMRRILVDRARARGAIKRGGEFHRVDLDAAADVLGAATPLDGAGPVDLLALDSALARLEQREPRQAEVVTLRYFAGLTIEQTAASLGLSPATVKADWVYAKAWLRRDIAEGGS
jgi:RNA polymerase sigma factor (TIGR02999 family)